MISSGASPPSRCALWRPGEESESDMKRTYVVSAFRRTCEVVRNARMITCESPVYLPFQPAERGLVCDGVSVHSIVERVGTPAYIYSARAIREAYRAIDAAFDGYPHAIHYALKANSTLRCAPDSSRATSCSPASARHATSSNRRLPTRSARSTRNPPASSIALG